jgi:hypothetical protein
VLAEMAAGLPPASAPAAVPQAPAPRIRLQGADDAFEPMPRPLTMPAPEEVGIASSSQSQGGVDWGTIRQRLENLGVKSFRVDRTPAGEVNVTFLLWLRGSRPRQVEGIAATEAEAVSLALVETERYLREHR